MLFLSCCLCCSRSPALIFIYSERMHCSRTLSLGCLCQADGVHQLNHRTTQRYGSSPHWDLFFFSPAGTLLIPESSTVSENISSGLRRATHTLCAGQRQCGGMWVSSVSMLQTVCQSQDLKGIGGEMGR